MTEVLKSKKSLATALLANQSAPRVFSPSELSMFLRKNNAVMPPRSLTVAISEWTAQGLIAQINNHVYLNTRSTPRPRPDEAAQKLRNKSVVSASRVLGDAGVLYNPVKDITAVMPSNETKKTGRVETPVASFVFSNMPPEMFIFDQSDAMYNDCVDYNNEYLKATPEKAIIDLIYLNASPSSKSIHGLQPKDRWDFDNIDFEKLSRLIKKFEMETKWNNVCDKIGAPKYPFSFLNNTTNHEQPRAKM